MSLTTTRNIVKVGSAVYQTIPDSSFRHDELVVQLDKTPPQNNTHQKLVFGKNFSPHILDIHWSVKYGWSKPLILPFQNLKINPAVKALHYAIQLFDGMKAFRGADDKIRLFRPELNIKRMLKGTERLALPAFDGQEFLKCIKALVNVDRDWVPHPGDSAIKSLYIRPTFLGTEPTLGVAPSSTAHLYVLTSPVDSYYSHDDEAISLYTDPRYVRAWPGGVGDIKLGSNYAPTVLLQKQANELGYQQVLWLYGPEYQITEVGTMNIFMFWVNPSGKLELITAPLDGLILPGITRQSILELARSWNEFEVSERTYTMSDLILGLKENRVKEFFGTGTAVVVTPVNKILFKNYVYEIPTMNQPKPLYKRIMKTLTDIQSGRTNHHDWTMEI